MQIQVSSDESCGFDKVDEVWRRHGKWFPFVLFTSRTVYFYETFIVSVFAESTATSEPGGRQKRMTADFNVQRELWSEPSLSLKGQQRFLIARKKNYAFIFMLRLNNSCVFIWIKSLLSTYRLPSTWWNQMKSLHQHQSQ